MKKTRIFFLIIAIIFNLLLIISIIRYMTSFPVDWKYEYDLSILAIILAISLFIMILMMGYKKIKKFAAGLFILICLPLCYLIFVINNITYDLRGEDISYYDEINPDYIDTSDIDDNLEDKHNNNLSEESTDTQEVLRYSPSSSESSRRNSVTSDNFLPDLIEKSPEVLKGKTVYLRLEGEDDIILYAIFENYFTNKQKFYLGFDVGNEIVRIEGEKYGLGIDETGWEVTGYADYDTKFTWRVYFSKLVSQSKSGEIFSSGYIKDMNSNETVKFIAYRINKID